MTGRIKVDRGRGVHVCTIHTIQNADKEIKDELKGEEKWTGDLYPVRREWARARLGLLPRIKFNRKKVVRRMCELWVSIRAEPEQKKRNARPGKIEEEKGYVIADG